MQIRSHFGYKLWLLTWGIYGAHFEKTQLFEWFCFSHYANENSVRCMMYALWTTRESIYTRHTCFGWMEYLSFRLNQFSFPAGAWNEYGQKPELPSSKKACIFISTNPLWLNWQSVHARTQVSVHSCTYSIRQTFALGNFQCKFFRSLFPSFSFSTVDCRLGDDMTGRQWWPSVDPKNGVKCQFLRISF